MSEREEKKLDRIIYLLEHLLAIDLSKTNLSWAEIAKHVVADKKKINKMLKGTKKRKSL